MILKSDGQKINIDFSQELLGNIQFGGNSRWQPSSFQIDFNVPAGAPTSALSSKSLNPISVEFAPAYDSFQPLNSPADASYIEIFDTEISPGIILPAIYLGTIEAL